jgi:hypothetical protein
VKFIIGAAAFGGLSMLAAATADARGVQVRQALVATGVDPDAAGQVRVEVRDRARGLAGRLEVRARKLDALDTFEVTLDGVRIGSFATRRRGAGKVRFDTRPRGNDQLLGADPRGKVVAVVNGDGVVVLQTTVGAGTLDPNDVRCCLPDDSGPECEDRTAAECAAAGGVDLGPGSCLPNPCDQPAPPPGGDIRCCIPDDSGPECEDRTPAECSAQGGVNIGAGSCDPNPCLPAATTTTLPGGATTTTVPGPASGSVRVRCEQRSDRSKVSVDGNDLRAGSYSARVISGANAASSGLQATVGDEVEFDFDSEPDDIAAGATAIGSDFIQGGQVTGQILDAGGAVVVESTVPCEIK